MPARELVVAGDLFVVGAGEVDPLEDRVVGRVGQLPFDRLDVDRDARKRGVLSGVVGVEVAVDDLGDVADLDAGLGQDLVDRPADRMVGGVQLGIPEAEAGIEQQDPALHAERRSP